MKMHADEIDVDAHLVRRLLRTQLPQWADRAIEPVQPWGTDNALFRVGDDMVARLPRHAPSVGALEKECRWLPQLAPLLPVPIPVPLAEGVPGEGYPFPWAIYPWFPGENATPDRIADPRQFGADLAQFVASLESIDSTGGPGPGRHNAYRGEPLERRDEETREAIAALREEIDVDRVTAVWEESLEAADWQGPPVWIHGDLDSRNLLVRYGRLSAVIDFGCLGIGDPASDIMVAWKLFPADVRNDFRKALSVDDATWARARGWVLSQALIALPYYTMETNPTLVLEARRWLTDVLADPRM